jgi:hypothetical protein
VSDNSRLSREKAEHCSRLADATEAPKLKAVLVKLAEGWRELAEKQHKWKTEPPTEWRPRHKSLAAVDSNSGPQILAR